MSFRQLSRHRGVLATACTAVAVLIAGGVLAVVGPGSGHEKLASTANYQPATATGSGGTTGTTSKNSGSGKAAGPARPAIPPLRVVSVTPASGKRHVNGTLPVKVTFNEPLAATSPTPALSPKVAGNWVIAGDTMTFTPDAGFQPETRVTVTIPGGKSGVQAAGLDAAGATTTAQAGAGLLPQSAASSFTTGPYSTLRLQQLLAQLGYLPLTSTAPAVPRADARAQLAAIYHPPAGGFTFKPGYPTQLTSQWAAGTANILDTGAIIAFQADNGLAMDGIAGPDVWSHLLSALAAGHDNPHGYTYALVSQHTPETLHVYHNGTLIEATPVNTGVPGAGTADGTYPVYSRFQVTQMKGTNPDGTKYDDTVHWVSYFNGGDALHYFPRPGYGYYQSNGCVEMQLNPAKYIWNYTTYGTLVTIEGPVA